MSFDDRITRVPRPYDTDRASEATLPGVNGRSAALLQGAAGCSPYLAGLIARESEWLRNALGDPEAAMRACLEIDPETANLKSALRQAKRRVALLTALADLGGVWPLETVTAALTDFADAACGLALRHALRPLIERNKLPGVSLDDLPNAAGLCVFAMGKMGAHELNYSSDIDLICLFDETRHAPEDYAELRSQFVRAVRGMCATLSDINEEGYVFRTDLRLRPDAGVTPVALSMGAAERYYESLGRTWERAAWIKGRPAAGDIDAGHQFQSGLRPFVWRRHLDFAAIQDAHDMRLAIRDAKGLVGPITLPGHDMKLGRGGIREIEFFTQTRQLIAGGRDESLRLRGTRAALAQLAARDWVPEARARNLYDHYRFHREVEHRLQMVQDAQTHALPRDKDGLERIAAMMDRDRAGLEVELRDRLADVHSQTEGFFAPQEVDTDADAIAPSVIERWNTYPAFRSDRARASFDRIKPALATGLGAAARPEEALAAIDGFLSGLPAGVQLFALFEANPQLVDLLLDILTTAPPLANYLARNAQVLDAVIGGDFFTPWPERVGLTEQLSKQLQALDDYERKLDLARRWMKEWHFRIGVHHLRGLIDAGEAGAQYADLADSIISCLWPHVIDQFEKRHGPPPGRGALILGMGSLGAGRLSPESDLDMIVIYDPLDVAQSDGPRSLPARTYFARLTQALITALSAQTAEGRLYEVDMRLRPSGNQGPVATSWRAFQDYQQNEAWIWEHLALTRARVVAGPRDLSDDVNNFLQGLLAQERSRSDVLNAVQDMRTRIAEAKPATTVWSVKTGPGRLQDIELFVQASALLDGRLARDISGAINAVPQTGLASETGAEKLGEAYDLAARAQMAFRLVSGDAQDANNLGDGTIGFLLRALESSDMQTAELRLDAAFTAAGLVIDAGLKLGEQDDDGHQE